MCGKKITCVTIRCQPAMDSFETDQKCSRFAAKWPPTFHNSFHKTDYLSQHLHSGSVVEHPLCDREVAFSIPGRVIPKTLKMVLAALPLGAQH